MEKYIITVGGNSWNIGPNDTAITWEEAVDKALEYMKEYHNLADSVMIKRRFVNAYGDEDWEPMKEWRKNRDTDKWYVVTED